MSFRLLLSLYVAAGAALAVPAMAQTTAPAPATPAAPAATAAPAKPMSMPKKMPAHTAAKTTTHAHSMHMTARKPTTTGSTSSANAQTDALNSMSLSDAQKGTNVGAAPLMPAGSSPAAMPAKK